MDSLLLATANPGKLYELTGLLKDNFKLLSPKDKCFVGKSIPEVIEDGRDYKENALKKSRAFFEVFEYPVLADDSGLEVKELGGEPGALSARFGGDRIRWDQRWEYLYSKLGKYPKSWEARFVCILCFFKGNGKPHFFEGIAEGVIVPKPKGNKGFGYDPIFYCTELGKTFGEATHSEKQQFSHRARAVKQFTQWYEKEFP